MFKITKLVHLLNAVRMKEAFPLLGSRLLVLTGDSCFPTNRQPLRRRLHLHLRLLTRLRLPLGSRRGGWWLQLQLGSHVARSGGWWLQVCPTSLATSTSTSSSSC